MSGFFFCWLTRREPEMPRLFAVNGKYFSKAAELATLLAAAMALMFVGRAQAQGPALTTISEARYSDGGWGGRL